MKIYEYVLMFGVLAGCIILMLSCTVANNLKDGDVNSIAVTKALVSIAARNIGYEVAKIGDAKMDRSIRNAYMLAKTGELTDDAILQLSEELKQRPTLAADVADLVNLLGVSFDVDGDVIDIEQFPPEIYEAIERSYIQGINFWIAEQ